MAGWPLSAMLASPLQIVTPYPTYAGSMNFVLTVQVGEPPLRKPVDAELGCVTPYIVVPGAWTPADIEYYADEIVAGLVHNAGHNCTKAELLVTDADWPLCDALIDALRCALHPALHPLHLCAQVYNTHASTHVNIAM